MRVAIDMDNKTKESCASTSSQNSDHSDEETHKSSSTLCDSTASDDGSQIDVSNWVYDYNHDNDNDTINDTSVQAQTEIIGNSLVSPKDYQTNLYDDSQVTGNSFGKDVIYKTPRSRVPTVEEKVVNEMETTPKKIRDTPLPLLTWAESEEVWQNLVYKEEATATLRNVRVFDDRATYLPRMRAILLDWIMEVCEVYHLRRNTYYLTVDYIDRYLTAKPSVPKTQLQLLGVACLFIAAKLEEIYPPKLSEFSYVCDGACTETEILTCEILLLNTLSWEVNAMTPSGWLNLYMQIHHNADVINKCKSLSLDNRHFEYPQYSGYEFVRASHLIDIFSMDPGFLRFSYSTIAAAAMFFTYGEEIALRVSGLKKKQLKECTNYMKVFNRIIEESLDPRLASIVPAQEDERLSRSFSYIRRHVPKLIQNEDHSIQTHLIDLDYFERSVLLRLEQYGIGVRKTFVRKYKTSTGETDFETLNEEPVNQEPPTVMVYELQPGEKRNRGDDEVIRPTHPTDVDYEAGKVNIFRLVHATTVTFDDILSSIHHDARLAKITKQMICSTLGYQ